MEFKDLSYLELIEVKKILDSEIEGRTLHKGDICSTEMNALFIRDWNKKDISEWASSENLSRLYASIYRICDFTLDNYKLTHAPGHGDTGKQIQVHGKRIECKNPDLYPQMMDEIFSIIIKYYKDVHCKES